MALLEEVDDDPQEFRDTFVCGIAMIRRVGHAIDVESRPRTHQFGQWWSQMNENPLHQCIHGVRNLVLKRIDEGTQVRHEVHVTDTAMATATAYDATVSTETTRINVARDGREEEYTFSATPTSKQELAEPTYRRTWVFAGGDCDGQELIPALRRYLKWMRDCIIPEAERLLARTD